MGLESRRDRCGLIRCGLIRCGLTVRSQRRRTPVAGRAAGVHGRIAAMISGFPATTDPHRCPRRAHLLAYAFVILAVIGLSLCWVVDLAIEQPISLTDPLDGAARVHDLHDHARPPTKEGSRGLALATASLSIPAVPLLPRSALLPAAIVVAVIAVVLLRTMTRPAVRTYLSEP
jgi:hypothetical protein